MELVPIQVTNTDESSVHRQEVMRYKVLIDGVGIYFYGFFPICIGGWATGSYILGMFYSSGLLSWRD